MLSLENDNFPVCRQSGQLKIGFSSSDLPIDLPFSGSRGGDLLLTITDINLANSRVRSNKLGGWVKSRVCLDTSTHIHKMRLERFIWFKKREKKVSKTLMSHVIHLFPNKISKPTIVSFTNSFVSYFFVTLWPLFFAECYPRAFATFLVFPKID